VMHVMTTSHRRFDPTTITYRKCTLHCLAPPAHLSDTSTPKAPALVPIFKPRKGDKDAAHPRTKSPGAQTFSTATLSLRRFLNVDRVGEWGFVRFVSRIQPHAC
jgi:hypothetical protein